MVLGQFIICGEPVVQESDRGRAKELLPPDVRFQGFRHENESFIILFYMV
jgi:hypothetical protein